MSFPENLKYAKTHEWVQFTDGGSARIGLTQFACDALGSIVFVNLPEKGDTVVAGESLGDVESVKAVADIIAPLSGTVSAVNEELLDAPEKIGDEPYDSWLVEISDITGQEDLMDASDYEALCQKEG